MVLTAIYSYILKSGRHNELNCAEILKTGIRNDRTLVVIDENNKVITGRDFPDLTTIIVHIESNKLRLSRFDDSKIIVPIHKEEKRKISFKLFQHDVVGLLQDTIASAWLSSILGISCRLVSIDGNFRQISSKHGGKTGELVSYSDASPVHLISEESLKFLNSKLKTEVTPLHFRPNLVVKGIQAFDEDNWKTVIINDCIFEVHHLCRRCIFTTVDPITSTKDINIEPLTTLARFRKNRNEPVTFGIYLIPRKTGTVNIGDIVRLDATGY